MKRPFFNYAGFIPVLILGFWLRIDAADWGLPFRLHPDEWKYVQGAAKVHQGQWNPKYFRNPPGYTYSNALWYPLWIPFSPEIDIPHWYPAENPPTDSVVETYHRKPYQLVLGARILSACFGTGLIVLTLLTAHGLRLGFSAALIASLLAAVSFISVRESHFAVNDASMAFWTVLAVAVGWFSLQKNTLRYLYLAAFLSGIAVAFKYSAYPAVLTMILFRLSPFLSLSLFSKHPLHLFRDIGLLILLPLLAFLLICPFPLTDSATFMDEMRKLSDAAVQGWQGQDPIWSGILLAESLWRSEGVLALLFSIWGSIALIQEKKGLIFLFPMLYLLMLMTTPLYFTRFCLPLLPFIAVTAGYGITRCAEKIKSGWGIYLITLITMLQPLASSLRGNDLLKQEDTRIEALRWLLTQEHEGMMAAGQFELPLVYWETAEPWSLQPALNIDALPSNRLHRLEEYPIRWIAVSTFSAFPGKIEDSFRERLQSIIQYTGSNQPEAVFTVFRSEGSQSDELRDPVRSLHRADVEDTYSPTTRLWQRERPGPEILIFPASIERFRDRSPEYPLN